MLNDFTWNMIGYIPKYQVNPHGDGIIPYVAERIFQLDPEPPAVDSLNEYILSALQEKNLLYFSFFLPSSLSLLFCSRIYLKFAHRSSSVFKSSRYVHWESP